MEAVASCAGKTCFFKAWILIKAWESKVAICPSFVFLFHALSAYFGTNSFLKCRVQNISFTKAVFLNKKKKLIV